MDETPAGFSIITTVTGVLLATVLIAVLGATIFMWIDTDSVSNAEPVAATLEEDTADADAINAQAADPATSNEVAASADNEAGNETDNETDSMDAAAGEATTEGSGAEDSAADEAEADATGSESTAMTDDATAAPEASPDVAATFMKGTCVGCHVIPGVPNAVGITGPDLAGIATTATTRVAGQSAEAYIRASILQPDEYIVPDCPTGPCAEGVMLPTFGEMLSEDELNGVVDYLLELE